MANKFEAAKQGLDKNFDNQVSTVKDKLNNPLDNIVNSTLNTGVGIANKALNELSPNTFIQRGESMVTSQVQHTLNALYAETLGSLKQDPAPSEEGSPFKIQMQFTLMNQDLQLVPLAVVQKFSPGFKEGFRFTMQVNPSSFGVTFPAKTVNPVRTLGGWQLQYWYPELGSISCQGVIGNLLARRNNMSYKNTPQWRSFDNLLQIYLMNGVGYKTKNAAGGFTSNRSSDTGFYPVTQCIYDDIIYYGYFESFTLTESEDNPFNRDYSFEFKFYDRLDSTLPIRGVVG
jgi:hypothetical protein